MTTRGDIMYGLYLVNEKGENFLTTMEELRDRVVNLDACLGSDGRFKIRGTKYIWYEEVLDDLTALRMTAYGGYEAGGRGCFYVKVDDDEN